MDAYNNQVLNLVISLSLITISLLFNLCYQSESGNNAADDEEETSDKSKSEVNDEDNEDEEEESGEVRSFALLPSFS